MSIKLLIKKEFARQKKVINLIPSENYPSKDTLTVLGSQLTSKYAEGYPGKRYYPGNYINDKIESYTQKLALKIFGLSPKSWHVNVQPYSGTPANIAVYLALLKPTETLMGMELTHGGHLSHGHKVNFSGMFYKVIKYGVNKDGLIDYREIEALAKKYKPKIIISGTTAYPRKIDFKKFGQIAHSISAYHMADISHIAGLVVAKLHQSPFPYADIVTTTTHKTLRGPRGALIFVNKNSKIAKSFNIDIATAIDRAVFPGIQGGPHLNVIAAIGIALEEALKPSFIKYQKQVLKNAKILAQELKKYNFNLVSGGTDNHLILIDLKNKNLTGMEAEKILENAGIVANRNSVPGDQSPFKPSGLRLGTPAQTTKGAKEKDMIEIARRINQLLTKK